MTATTRIPTAGTGVGCAPTPIPGQAVRIRTRTYLVESVQPSPGTGTLIRLACLDDDAQGQSLEVVWELELDPEILDRKAWQSIGKRGFDNPPHFSAFIHTLRWNCVTATDPRLFQAPFRAGIRLDAHQLEPLRKALLLPRVNLFIADDVGLGKTIEAALIASELLLRRRVREILVACPPSMVPQWKDELEARFGLTFEVLDRAYLERIRQERGYGVNRWTTFPRFLISHKLLIDETYTGPLRDWLDNPRPGSLLILDEAHHAAPSSGAKYAIDSRITRANTILGMGFTFDDTDKNGVANPLALMRELIAKNPRNADRIFPYLGGEEVSDDPQHSHDRYVIHFADFPLRRVEMGCSRASADAKKREAWLRAGVVPLD